MKDRVLWQGRNSHNQPVRAVWHKFADGTGDFMVERFSPVGGFWFTEGWLDATSTAAALTHDLLPPLWFAHRWNRLCKTLRRR